MLLGDPGQPLDQKLRCIEGRQIDDERLEILVIVLRLVVVVRRPGRQIGFRPRC